jgi:hypothetical protein
LTEDSLSLLSIDKRDSKIPHLQWLDETAQFSYYRSTEGRHH